MLKSMLSRSGCLRVTRVLQSYLDGEADAATSTIVAKHLEECRRCGLEASTYRAIKVAITETGPDVAPVDAEAVERLRRFAEELSEQQP
jgi:anti-sigma factor RsiW